MDSIGKLGSATGVSFVIAYTTTQLSGREKGIVLAGTLRLTRLRINLPVNLIPPSLWILLWKYSHPGYRAVMGRGAGRNSLARRPAELAGTLLPRKLIVWLFWIRARQQTRFASSGWMTVIRTFRKWDSRRRPRIARWFALNLAMAALAK